MVYANVAQRTCIVLREARDEAELVRFVVAPDQCVVPDLGRKLPGRGVWVSLSKSAVAEATRRRLFARALHRDCRVEPDLADRVEGLLERDALALVSLANKAGQVVQGFDKVQEAIAAGRVRLLLGACDGAADGRRRLAGRLKSGSSRTQVAECFTSEQLGLALGRGNVIHAAVAAGPLAEKLAAAVRRLETYRGVPRAEVTVEE